MKDVETGVSDDRRETAKGATVGFHGFRKVSVDHNGLLPGGEGDAVCVRYH